MPTNDHLLGHLCQEEETLNEAQSLLRRAQKKTGPGSGYELGPHTTGLPAICALLASQKLNNGDVTEKAAQMASCLKASDFSKALGIVRAAVGDSGKNTDPRKLYDQLLSQYNITLSPQTFKKWLKEAGELIQAEDKKINPEDPAHGKIIKCAIFYWAYESATGKPLSTQKGFAEEHAIPLKSFTRVLTRISPLCLLLRSRIAREAAEKATSTPTKAASTPRRTPRKQPLRELPSRDTPSKRKLDDVPEELGQSGSPRSYAAEALPETPSKRPRTGSPLKPRVTASTTKTLASRQLQRLPSPPAAPKIVPSEVAAPDDIPADERSIFPSLVSPQPENPTVENVAESVQGVTPAPAEKHPLSLPRRRYRPVYLDTLQWYSMDRRIAQLPKQTRVR